MKISVSVLNKIINEELSLVLDDKKSCRGSAVHSYSTGEFVNKDKEKGSYSLSDIADGCDRPRTQATRRKGSDQPGKNRKPCGRKDRRKKCRGMKEKEVLIDPPRSGVERPQTPPPIPKVHKPAKNAVKRLETSLEMNKAIVGKLGLTTSELATLMNILVDAVSNRINADRNEVI